LLDAGLDTAVGFAAGGTDFACVGCATGTGLAATAPGFIVGGGAGLALVVGLAATAAGLIGAEFAGVRPGLPPSEAALVFADSESRVSRPDLAGAGFCACAPGLAPMTAAECRTVGAGATGAGTVSRDAAGRAFVGELATGR
jgi:hypothetical protein